MEVTFQEIKEELKKGCRVLMLTRHAERKKINHEDPTFGESLPITDEGISTSIKFLETTSFSSVASNCNSLFSI